MYDELRRSQPQASNSTDGVGRGREGVEDFHHRHIVTASRRSSSSPTNVRRHGRTTRDSPQGARRMLAVGAVDRRSEGQGGSKQVDGRA
ncbi:MAG: hypothetical protein IPI29_08535 [Ignavibacteria bacterium]|nr:hypothetical protein [Ignavibacteria bacterium]